MAYVLTVKDTQRGTVFYSNIKALDSPIDTSSRLAAIESAGEKAIPALLLAMHDKDPNVRRNVVEVLSRVTANDFGDDPPRWWKWWSREK